MPGPDGRLPLNQLGGRGAARNSVPTWTGSRWKPAPITLPTGTLAYRAAWNASLTYATNDVVTDAYSLYVALAPVPAAAGVPGSNPAIPLQIGLLNDVAPGAGTAGTGNSSGMTYAFAFIPSTNSSVTQLSFVGQAQNSITTCSASLGIASAIGASPSALVSMGSGTINSTASGYQVFTVTLGTPVALVAGTTYYFYYQQNGANPGFAVQYDTAPPAAAYVKNGTLGTTYQSTGGAAAYTTGTAPAVIYATANGSPYWQKIANTGNQENVNLVAASGSAQTLPDPEYAAMSRITLSAACTLTFPTPVAGRSFTLTLKQDATGSRTVTWPASVVWPGGTAPTLTTTAAKADVFSFMADDATNWRGFVAGQNFA